MSPEDYLQAMRGIPARFVANAILVASRVNFRRCSKTAMARERASEAHDLPRLVRLEAIRQRASEEVQRCRAAKITSGRAISDATNKDK